MTQLTVTKFLTGLTGPNEPLSALRSDGKFFLLVWRMDTEAPKWAWEEIPPVPGTDTPAVPDAEAPPTPPADCICHEAHDPNAVHWARNISHHVDLPPVFRASWSIDDVTCVHCLMFYRRE